MQYFQSAQLVNSILKKTRKLIITPALYHTLLNSLKSQYEMQSIHTIFLLYACVLTLSNTNIKIKRLIYSFQPLKTGSVNKTNSQILLLLRQQKKKETR